MLPVGGHSLTSCPRRPTPPGRTRRSAGRHRRLEGDIIEKIRRVHPPVDGGWSLTIGSTQSSAPITTVAGTTSDPTTTVPAVAFEVDNGAVSERHPKEGVVRYAAGTAKRP